VADPGSIRVRSAPRNGAGNRAWKTLGPPSSRNVRLAPKTLHARSGLCYPADLPSVREADTTTQAMTSSVHNSSSPNEFGRLHTAIVVVAWINFIGLVLGGLVTSSDSAVIDPEWPSFAGAFLPDVSRVLADGRLFVEHTHRILMGLTLVGTLAVGSVLCRHPLSTRRVRRVAVFAMGLVVVIAVLGGLTVLLGKSPPLSVLHVSLAAVFVACLWSLSARTSPKWREAGDAKPLEERGARRILTLALASVVAIWVQIVLGAVPRHATAEFGGRTLVIVGDLVHIVGAFGVSAVILLTHLEVGRHARKRQWLLRPALGSMLLLVFQILLGFVAFFLQPKDPPSQTVLGAATPKASPVPTVDSASAPPSAGSSALPIVATRADAAPAAGRARADGSHVISASAHQAIGLWIFILAVTLHARARRDFELATARGVSADPRPETRERAAPESREVRT
jgi:heme A synthase